MEEFIIVVVVSFLLFVYIVVKLLSSDESSVLDRIPGPRRLPVIGNLHLLAGGSPYHHVFRDLAAEHGPLMRLQLGEIPYVVVSSVEVAKQVLRTHDVVFANRIPMLAAATITYGYKGIALASYGEHWRQLKKICKLELLSSRRVGSFRRIREEENSSLATWIASGAGSPVNLSERLYLSSFDIIARATVGNKAQNLSRFTWAIHENLKLVTGFSIADLFPSNRLLLLITGINFTIARNFRATDDVLQSIIDQHMAADDNKTERSEDLVDILLKYQQNEAQEFQLSTDTIKAAILDIMFGGSDSSTSTLGWAMSEMIRNPSTLKKAQEEVREVFDGIGHVDEDKFDEMEFLKLVIKETLRLHPPVPLLVPRMSREQCEINGYDIPVNTRMMINAWALGRDPKQWNEPEKFKPERFDNTSSTFGFRGNELSYVPFGSGRRVCPGIAFAMVNVEHTLATLLYHFDWEMPFGLKNEQLDMREDLRGTIRRKTDLLLVPTVKRPLH